ncbi:hypothetical protein Hdeb2414_s0005g00183741 [Helianthus debilis subsp. tardiflorus]
MPALIQSIKDKDELAKCKDQLAQYKNDDLFMLSECNVVAINANEKETVKDEVVVKTEEPDIYIYFEDQDSEILRPYLEQQTENEKTFEDPTKGYDPEVLEHAWDYTYWDEEDDWYHNPYEEEHGSDSDCCM